MTIETSGAGTELHYETCHRILPTGQGIVTRDRWTNWDNKVWRVWNWMVGDWPKSCSTGFGCEIRGEGSGRGRGRWRFTCSHLSSVQHHKFSPRDSFLVTVICSPGISRTWSRNPGGSLQSLEKLITLHWAFDSYATSCPSGGNDTTEGFQEWCVFILVKQEKHFKAAF